MTDESELPPLSREDQIARNAARILKAGKPRFKRLIALTRPRAEVAGKQAAQYVREHEEELRDAALRLARARLGGPLGMVVGGLADNLAGSRSGQASSAVPCPACSTLNAPASNFCSECGQALKPKAPS